MVDGVPGSRERGVVSGNEGILPFLALFASSLLVAGCVGIDVGGPRGADAGASSAPIASDAGGPTGVDCAEDPITRVTLCTATTKCPNLAVDHDQFPRCGFRIREGGAFDLECWCDRWVCPMGAPKTCEDARALLASQTEVAVCTQVNEGRCLEVAKAPSASPGSNGSNGGSTCDRRCMSECGPSAGCKQVCGCE
jgi:hypothetical protein